METYADRVQACCDSTELPAVIPDSGVNLLPTDEEMTALGVTKLAADSEAGMVFMNRFNEVVALARGQETPTLAVGLGLGSGCAATLVLVTNASPG